MYRAIAVILALIITLSVTSSLAQEQTIEVGEIVLPLEWGLQKASFDITNPTEELKFVTAEAVVQFSGSYLGPNRRALSPFILPPGESVDATADVYIPGNYGRADITLRLYDVIDTLDLLAAGNKFFQQGFSVLIPAPKALEPYLERPISLPPRVEIHPLFDFEFVRLLMVLVREGKSLDEIIEITGAKPAYVNDVIETVVEKGYLSRSSDSITVNIPVILEDEARSELEIAVATSDSLVALITGGMDAYWLGIDSLIAAGAMGADTNDFLDGSVVLHFTYPTVSALALWWDLGQRFITRSAPLLIYDGTDPCNADNPYYMYAVQSSDEFPTNHFYFWNLSQQLHTILYGDGPPDIKCNENFLLAAKRGTRAGWRYAEGYRVERFMMDTALTRTVLAPITAPATELLDSTYFTLRDMAVGFGHKRLSFGHRYWFWNVVATRTLRILAENGVIERRGNGQYRFEERAR